MTPTDTKAQSVAELYRQA